MVNYVVHPIAVCQGPRDGSHFTYRANFGVNINTACYAWYITGSSQKILVDTGARAATFREKGAERRGSDFSGKRTGQTRGHSRRN